MVWRTILGCHENIHSVGPFERSNKCECGPVIDQIIAYLHSIRIDADRKAIKYDSISINFEVVLFIDSDGSNSRVDDLHWNRESDIPCASNTEIGISRGCNQMSTRLPIIRDVVVIHWLIRI